MSDKYNLNITGSGNQISIGNNNTQKNNSDNINAPSTLANDAKPKNKTPESIRNKRKQTILEQLEALYAQYDLETRVEERLRMKAIIAQKEQDLAELD